MSSQQVPLVIEQRKAGVLEHLLRTLRKRRWLILTITIIGGLVGAGISLAQGSSYDATANVLLRNPNTLVAGTLAASADPSRDAATSEQLMRLPQVANRAAQIAGGGLSEKQVRDMISTSGGNGDLVQITASASSGNEAARVANAYAAAFIELRQQTERARIAAATAAVRKSLSSLSAADSAGSQGAGLRSELQTLQTLGTVQAADAQVVVPAQAPASATSRDLVRNTLFGLLGGLLVGLLIAIAFERVDHRIKSIEELEEIYTLPVLTRVPRSRSLGKRVRQDPLHVMTEALSRTQEAEAFRTLRANLRYFNVDRRLKSVLVASPMSGEGKSTVASFLAIAMAAMGDNVVLVEADLRKSGAETPLSDFGGDGLSLVLAGFDLDEAVTEVPVSVDALSEEPRTLARLPHGPLPPNPSELLESDRMRWVIRELEQRYDMVIIDSPALSNVSDALALVPQVSGVLIVSGLNHTTNHAAYNLRKQIALLGGHPLGVVANYASSERDDYYYAGSYSRPLPSLPR